MAPNISQEKRTLLNLWLSSHSHNNCVPLFITKAPSYQLSPTAIKVLKKDKIAEMSLYVVVLEDPEKSLIPVYIGKAIDPWQRWNNGHVRRLRKAATGAEKSSYTRWVNVLEGTSYPINLICLAESEIKFPPIPEFPTTVGSCEYQLISLAQDCVPISLLNYEGVKR